MRTRRRGTGGRWLGALVIVTVGSLAAVTEGSGVAEAGDDPGASRGTPPVVEAVERRLEVEQAPLTLREGLRERAADAVIPELPEGVSASPLLGSDRGLDLHLPSADPIVVGFHEAATATALTLRPVGQLAEDRNTTRTDLPPDDESGAPYLVLSSRGRAAGPTSAIDVLMEEDDPVLASVTGTVVDVRSYLLYGAHPDHRIEIAPAGRPDLRVIAIHVRDPHVAVGDPVVGGVTSIAASVRRFPFSSQIDRETEPDRFGHVHLEVQPRTARRPGDDVRGPVEPPGDGAARTD